MSHSKSIKKLYEEIKDYDLVITNDTPLNTALTKLVHKPQLGSFALTSRLLGFKYAMRLFENEQLDTPCIVLKVKEELNISLKEALHYIQNILSIWQHTGKLKEVEKYISKEEKKVLKIIDSLPTYQKAMKL